MTFLRRAFLREQVVASTESETISVEATTCAYAAQDSSTHLAGIQSWTAYCGTPIGKHGSITDSDEIRFNLTHQDDAFHYCGDCVQNLTGIHGDLVRATRKQKA